MPRFSGKVVIVTGSSSGIGRATALLFAKRGAQVTITGRDATKLEETRQAILKICVPPENVNVVVADVTSEAGQDAIIGSTIKKFGKINILINNAGAAIPDKTGAGGVSQNISVYDANLKLNIRSVVELTQKATPYLASTKGEIVNVSSVAAGPRATPDFNYYSLAKAALDQYTKNCAISLIEQGIRVNSVSPGVTSTGFSSAAGMPQELADQFATLMAQSKTAIPAGFVAQPRDIAESIIFLADRRLSSYIIGHHLIVDGGATLVMGYYAQDVGKLLK